MAVDGEVLEAEVGRKLAISWHVNYDENRGVGEGWPWILHSLKSLLETGTPLPRRSGMWQRACVSRRG